MGILLGRVGRRRGRRGFERGGFERGCSCYYFEIPGHMGGGVEILLLDYALFSMLSLPESCGSFRWL